MPKRGTKYISEFVYGGMDGAITTFAIVAGVVGASLSSTIILILGFANLFADGFSMASANYLSTKSENERFTRKHRPHLKDPKKTAVATFLSFLAIGIIPLLSFIVAIFNPTTMQNQFLYSAILTGAAFLVVGGIKGKIIDKNIPRAAIETLIIGGVAATLAYIIGYLLRGLA